MKGAIQFQMAQAYTCLAIGFGFWGFMVLRIADGETGYEWRFNLLAGLAFVIISLMGYNQATILTLLAGDDE